MGFLKRGVGSMALATSIGYDSNPFIKDDVFYFTAHREGLGMKPQTECYKTSLADT